MTVPHGLRLGWEREQLRHALVEEAVAMADLERYAVILASVEQADWFGAWSELVLRVGVPIVPESVEHRHAKACARAREDQRRRRPAAAEAE